MDAVHQNNLIEAVIRNDKERVIELLSRGADVNKENGYGWSALRTAARNGHADLVKYLISAGAQIDAKNICNGRTALIFATVYRRLTVVEALLKLGANIDSTDQRGKSALILASELDYEDIASILLEEGADVNATDNDGQTALNLAKKRGHSVIVKLLLDKGADANKGDELGKTASSVANDERAIQTDSATSNVKRGTKTSTQIQSTVECLELIEVKTLLAQKELEIKILTDKITEVEYHISNLYKASTEQKLRDFETRAVVEEMKECENAVKPSKIQSISKELFELKRQNTELQRRIELLTIERDDRMKSQKRAIDDLKSRLDGKKMEQSPALLSDELVALKDRIKRLESQTLLLQIQAIKASDHFKIKIQLKNLETETTEMKKKINNLENTDVFEKKIKNLTKTLSGLEREVGHLQIAVIEKSVEDASKNLNESCQATEAKEDFADIEDVEINELKDIKEEKIERLETNDAIIDIFGITRTSQENLHNLVGLLSRIAGTKAIDVEKVTRLTRNVIRVQFVSIESTRSWLDAFEKKTRDGLDILACNLNRSLDKSIIRVINSNDVKEGEVNLQKQLELNEIEQEKLLDTIEIFGITRVAGENLRDLVELLSRILGTTTLGVEEVTRLTKKDSIQVQFLSVESAQSWLNAFKKKTGNNLDILACNLNRSLNKERVLLRQKLTPYNRDIWNQLRNKKEKSFGFWEKGGKIFVRQHGHRQTIRIRSIDDIPT